MRCTTHFAMKPHLLHIKAWLAVPDPNNSGYYYKCRAVTTAQWTTAGHQARWATAHRAGKRRRGQQHLPGLRCPIMATPPADEQQRRLQPNATTAGGCPTAGQCVVTAGGRSDRCRTASTPWGYPVSLPAGGASLFGLSARPRTCNPTSGRWPIASMLPRVVTGQA